MADNQPPTTDGRPPTATPLLMGRNAVIAHSDVKKSPNARSRRSAVSGLRSDVLICDIAEIDNMPSESERTKILDMIEGGIITAEEGLRLLQVLDDSAAESTSAVESASAAEPRSTSGEGPESEAARGWDAAEVIDHAPPPAPPDPAEIRKWKRWWVVPLWIGAGITVIGGLLMYWAFSASGFGFWFACAWFPFLLGVAVLALAWGSRTSPWLHVRVHQKPGEKPEKIAISFPIPIRLTAWGLRTFGHHLPNMDATGLDEIILALGDTADAATPFFVDVDEGEGGERVQVFIG